VRAGPPGRHGHHEERHPTLAARGPEAVTENILEVASGLAGKARADGLEPVAVGIAVPGVVDEENGVAVWSSNVGFRDVPLRARVEERLGLPAALGHDVRVGGIAEARLGAGRGERHVLFAAIGTGIAAALVVNGAATTARTARPASSGTSSCARAAPPARAAQRLPGGDRVGPGDRRRYAELSG
jgi:glucokinase